MRWRKGLDAASAKSRIAASVGQCWFTSLQWRAARVSRESGIRQRIAACIVRAARCRERRVLDHDLEFESCVICSYGRVMQARAHMADGRWPICKLCAGAGATLRREGVLDLVRHCLRLVALEIERFASEMSGVEAGPLQRWRGRINIRLSDGALLRACPCDGCNGRPVAGAIVDVHAHFGVDPGLPADKMDLLVLRSMKDSERLTASDGSVWRAIDEIARRMVQNHVDTVRDGPVPGGLAERAGPVFPGRWQAVESDGVVVPFYRVGERFDDQAADARSRAYWRNVAAYGPGYVDGVYWVDGDGVCRQRVDL